MSKYVFLFLIILLLLGLVISASCLLATYFKLEGTDIADNNQEANSAMYLSVTTSSFIWLIMFVIIIWTIMIFTGTYESVFDDVLGIDYKDKIRVHRAHKKEVSRNKQEDFTIFLFTGSVILLMVCLVLNAFVIKDLKGKVNDTLSEARSYAIASVFCLIFGLLSSIGIILIFSELKTARRIKIQKLKNNMEHNYDPEKIKVSRTDRPGVLKLKQTNKFAF